MIRSITFNKTYSVEPWFKSDNPKLKIRKIKLNPYDRNYGKKEYDEYLYIPLFQKNLHIDFKPNINVIVGANGCGKSQLFTILDCLLNNKDTGFELNAEIDFDKINSVGIDFESDLLKNIINPNPNDNTNFISDTVLKIDSEQKSHGENNKILFEKLSIQKNSIIFMDEPENGLDLPSQIKLINNIKELSKNNQVFVISHNKIIIDSFDEIYDLDRKRWTTPSELFKHLKLK